MLVYRFALTPRWIAGHILALVLIVGFVFAGFWQLSRHEWRTELNNEIEERAELLVLGAGDLAGATPDEIEYRAAVISGTWVDSPIAVRNRSSGGQSGCHVLGLLQPDGESFAVVVNRGWVDLQTCEIEDRSALAPAATRVEVLGRVRTTEERSRLGSRDPADGVLDTLNRVDVPRIEQQVDIALAPVFVELVDVAPPDATVRLLPPPSLESGPHLAYAVQWFAFAGVGLIGYPLVLRWQSRSKGSAAPGASEVPQA